MEGEVMLFLACRARVRAIISGADMPFGTIVSFIEVEHSSLERSISVDDGNASIYVSDNRVRSDIDRESGSMEVVFPGCTQLERAGGRSVRCACTDSTKLRLRGSLFRSAARGLARSKSEVVG